jgi:hypothetical protein
MNHEGMSATLFINIVATATASLTGKDVEPKWG